MFSIPCFSLVFSLSSGLKRKSAPSHLYFFKMVRVLRIVAAGGMKIPFVRLGLCWLNNCRPSICMVAVFITLIFSSAASQGFLSFCRLISWFSYFFLAIADQPRYLLGHSFRFLVYSSRPYIGNTSFFSRKTFFGASYGGDVFSERPFSGSSDQGYFNTSVFDCLPTQSRLGIFTSRALVRGSSARYFRSLFSIGRLSSRSVRAVWPVRLRSFWFRSRQLLSFRFRYKRLCRRRRFRRRIRARRYKRRYKRRRWKKRRFFQRRSAQLEKFFYVRYFRKRNRGLARVFPNPVKRNYRFIRKFRALFTVRALHTNLFFTIRQGNAYFLASTGMFDDLKHGTKRKRTLLAGWFLADRLFERTAPFLKEKTIFRVDLYGRTSGRRGIWFSWRTKPWRLYHIRSRTPIAYNGTRGCRRRRL